MEIWADSIGVLPNVKRGGGWPAVWCTLTSPCEAPDASTSMSSPKNPVFTGYYRRQFHRPIGLCPTQPPDWPSHINLPNLSTPPEKLCIRPPARRSSARGTDSIQELGQAILKQQPRDSQHNHPHFPHSHPGHSSSLKSAIRNPKSQMSIGHQPSAIGYFPFPS